MVMTSALLTDSLSKLSFTENNNVKNDRNLISHCGKIWLTLYIYCYSCTDSGSSLNKHFFLNTKTKQKTPVADNNFILPSKE